MRTDIAGVENTSAGKILSVIELMWIIGRCRPIQDGSYNKPVAMLNVSWFLYVKLYLAVTSTEVSIAVGYCLHFGHNSQAFAAIGWHLAYICN